MRKLRQKSAAQFYQHLSGLPQSGKKSGKLIFFQVREKSGNFNFSQGNLENIIKVREKSGNLRSLQKSQLVKSSENHNFY